MNNCWRTKPKGPLTTEETSKQLKYWIHREEQKHKDKFKSDEQQLNLKINKEELYECQGRIEVNYPIYLPSKSLLSEKLIYQSHLKTIHGGVSLTMAHIKSDHWIPLLRQPTKKIINKCHSCKKFNTKPYPCSIQGQLPEDRTEQNRPFKVIGADCAGPIYCKTKSKKKNKVHIFLFTCGISRAAHLEVLPNQTTEEFIKAVKWLIVRRGRPQVIYSDNVKTFVSTSKWVQKINKGVELKNFQTREKMKWKFNLSRAPWWGGQFKWMIRLMRQMLYKAMGNVHLTMTEIQEMVLYIEINMDNQLFTYLDNDIEQSILTPNVLLQRQIISVTDIQLEDDNPDIRKRQRYINKCKQAAWRRWSNDYLKELRERHNMK